jgi:hypothetical protein
MKIPAMTLETPRPVGPILRSPHATCKAPRLLSDAQEEAGRFREQLPDSGDPKSQQCG